LGLGTWRFADALPFPVWLTDGNGVTRYANPVFSDMLGPGLGTNAEDGWCRAVCADDRSRVLAEWERARTSSTAMDVEARLHHGQQQAVHAWRMHLRPVTARPGTVRYWIGSACDDQVRQEPLSEVGAAREELARFRSIQRELLHTLAHDLRAPLNAMLGWTRLLKGQAPSVGVVEHGLGVLERQIELLADLASEIGDLADMLDRREDARLLGIAGSSTEDVTRLRNLVRQQKASSGVGEPDRDSLELLSPLLSNGRVGTLSRVTALVVDDDPHEAQLIVHALETAGADVHHENSALTALGAIRELLPDVLLAKVKLPVVDGWTFIRQVRTWSPHKGGNIPAIALAASESDDERTRSLREGFQHHLIRPVSSHQIVATVAELLGRPS
jgi:CheY-like chemotaxis protein